MRKHAAVLLYGTLLAGCINTDDLAVRNDIEIVDVMAAQRTPAAAATSSASSGASSPGPLLPGAEPDSPLRPAPLPGTGEQLLTPLTPSDQSLTAQLEADLREAGLPGSTPLAMPAASPHSETALQVSDPGLAGDELNIVGTSSAAYDHSAGSYLPTDTDLAARPQAAAAASDLPTYASHSALAEHYCDPEIESRATQAAFSLTQSLLLRYREPRSQIYVAPTLIPSQYSDCIPNLKTMITHAIETSEAFEIVTSRELDESFEIYSGTAVPALIRSCRQLNIPFIAVSNIRKSGQDPALTVRFIRVQDGITLFQSNKKISSDSDSAE